MFHLRGQEGRLKPRRDVGEETTGALELLTSNISYWSCSADPDPALSSVPSALADDRWI